jgi:hypothetical protein
MMNDVKDMSEGRARMGAAIKALIKKSAAVTTLKGFDGISEYLDCAWDLFTGVTVDNLYFEGKINCAVDCTDEENDMDWSYYTGYGKNKHSGTGTGSGKSKYSYKSCWEDHPVVELGAGKFYGGHCNHPPKGYDVSVGLDYSTKDTSFPWTKKQVRFLFEIKDFSAPSNAADFKALINYLEKALNKGGVVHVGCLGGHGRTGLVLAALVAQMTGRKNAIEWTRKNYCKSAVESKEQINFLMNHYGVDTAEPSKKHSFYGGGDSGYSGTAIHVSYPPLTQGNDYRIW